MYQQDIESVACNTSAKSDATLSMGKRCNGEGEAMSIGNRLKQARKRLGMTQATAAAMTKIPLTTYKGYEMDQRSPGADSLESLSRFGVNVNWLLTGEGAMLLKDAGQTAPPPAVDANTLMTVMEEVERALATRRLQLAPAKKARLVGVLYDYVKSSGNKESAAVERFLELMT